MRFYFNPCGFEAASARTGLKYVRMATSEIVGFKVIPFSYCWDHRISIINNDEWIIIKTVASSEFLSDLLIGVWMKLRD